MNLLSTGSAVLVTIVALLHLYFLVLEMFLWEKPLGLKTFRNFPDKAKVTAVLAANQGLYNGFLAVGLLISFFFENPEITYAFQVYFLACVIVAGLYGAKTVSRRILYVQSGPAILALIFVYLNRTPPV